MTLRNLTPLMLEVTEQAPSTTVVFGVPQSAASRSRADANASDQTKMVLEPRRSAQCTFTSCSRRRVQYLWHAGRDGDSKEVHGQGHPSHHSDKQVVARVAMGTQALLESFNQVRSLELKKNK